MTDEIILAGETKLSTHLAEVAEEARQIIASGVPANTRRTYRSQWGLFLAWCHQHDRCPLPASGETIVLYLTDRSHEVKVSSLEVGLAAITIAHREAGHTNWASTDLPGVRIFMRGLRREKGARPKKKRAMTLDLLKKGLPSGSTPAAVRDRAILLVGFFSALRRAELSALDVEDVSEIGSGLRIEVWASKTDKAAEGQVVSVPRLFRRDEVCPVLALRAWIADRTTGPLFTALHTGSRLQPQAIAGVVKQAAQRAGLPPKEFAGHSLRSGFVTSAARADAKERDIMTVTRHTSERTVRGYIQEATLGDNHPGKKIVE